MVEDKAENLALFGLSDPSLVLTITEKDNKTRQLLVGDSTPTGEAVYAKLADDPRVFTMATYSKNSLDKSFDDLRDKRLITAELDKISRMDLTQNRKILNSAAMTDQWKILKPKPMRADNASKWTSWRSGDRCHHGA